MNKLSHLRVLVVEDDSAVAMLIEDMLDELGCEIAASVPRLAKAFEIIDSLDFDLAVLDVNVDGEPVFPLAQRLREQGKQIMFSTGYGRAGLPVEFAGCPVLAKPFSMSDLQRLLETVR